MQHYQLTGSQPNTISPPPTKNGEKTKQTPNSKDAIIMVTFKGDSRWNYDKFDNLVEVAKIKCS